VSWQYLDINGGELVVDSRGRKVNGEGVLPLLALRDGHSLVHDAQTLLEDENVINTLLSSSLMLR
jgi:hypothetical protein